MQLRDAILRVVPFCDKKDAILRNVRFIPSTVDETGKKIGADMLQAFNGKVGIRIPVNLLLPNVAVDGEFLSVVAKGIAYIEGINQVSDTTIEFWGNSVGKESITRYTYQVDPASVKQYPASPIFPSDGSWWDCLEWKKVRGIAELSGGKSDNPLYQHVQFTPRGLLATDRLRVGWADICHPWEGLLPAELFDRWPSDCITECAWSPNIAFFRLDQEIRWGKIQSGNILETVKYTQKEMKKKTILAPTVALRKAVEAAGKATKSRAIKLSVSEKKILIQAWSRNKDVMPFETTILCDEGGIEPDIALVSGRLLADSLAALVTPQVWIQYSKDPKEPIVLEGGLLSISVWPMIRDENEVMGGR